MYLHFRFSKNSLIINLLLHTRNQSNKAQEIEIESERDGKT